MQRRTEHPLTALSALRNDGRRDLRIHPCLEQALDDLIEMRQPHEEHTGVPILHQRIKRDARGIMTVHDMETEGKRPMSRRDACRLQRGDGRADAWHERHIDAMSAQKQRFFSASAQHKRIATFQAHHMRMLTRLLQQQRIDLILAHERMTAALAHGDLLA